MIGALTKYVAHMKSFGLIVTEATCDAGSEVGQDFRAAAAQLGLAIVPIAPEQFGPGGHERMYQTLAHDMAGNLLAQENLGEAHWLYALMDAQERRNAIVNDAHPTKSAHELVTRRPPLYSQLTAYNFGALAASKVVGPQRPHQPNYELVAVVGSPNDIHRPPPQRTTEF